MTTIDKYKAVFMDLENKLVTINKINKENNIG